MDLIDRFKLIAAEFADEEADFLNDHLAIAAERVAESAAQRDQKICLLAAHNIDLSLKRKGTSGQVTSIKVGSAQLTYTSGNPQSEFEFSGYGRAYLQLLRDTNISIMTRVCE